MFHVKQNSKSFKAIVAKKLAPYTFARTCEVSCKKWAPCIFIRYLSKVLKALTGAMRLCIKTNKVCYVIQVAFKASLYK